MSLIGHELVASLPPEPPEVPVCRRCRREAVGWLLDRGGDRCSPRNWASCIRDPFVVIAENAARAER